MKSFRMGFLILAFAVMIASVSACTTSHGTSNSQTISSTVSLSALSSSEKCQSELNAELKQEATQADFVQLNGHESEYKNKKVFVEGTIESIKAEGWPGGEFSLSTKEKDGYGIYDIFSLDSEHEYKVGTDIKQNDKIKVWGDIEGTDNSGAPKITAIIIEKE